MASARFSSASAQSDDPIYSSARFRVGVVGAGVAGLSAARALKAAGFDVVVLEREAVVGGRARSREAEGNIFDLGAQYIEADHGRFREALQALQHMGTLHPWTPKTNLISKGRLTAPRRARYHVAAGGQGNLCVALASGLDIRLNIEVQRAYPTGEDWLLAIRDTRSTRWAAAAEAQEMRFDFLVLAVTPEVALRLLSEVPSISKHISHISLVQAWVLCLTFSRSLELPFELAVSKESAVLCGFIRQNGKPGRSNCNETWWLQAKPEWSAKQRNSQKVEASMLQAFREEVGPLDKFDKSDVISSYLHHWSSARVPKDVKVSTTLAEMARGGAILDCEYRVALCGDWVYMVGERHGSIQGAYLSGLAAADKIERVSK